MLLEIFRAFGEYKKLTACLIVAVVLMIFGWVMAARAIAKRNKERDAVLEKLRREHALRREFADLTAEKAANADPETLLHALAVQIQAELEKQSDINASFGELAEEKQYIYALNYLLCEDAQTLSAFFRLNGAPLTDAALQGARAMFDEPHLRLMEKGYKMFDSDDETTSALPEDVQALDSAFGEQRETLLAGIRQYITDHAKAFEYHLEG